MTTKRKPEDRGQVARPVRPWVKHRRKRWGLQDYRSQYAILRDYHEYHQRRAKAAVVRRERGE